MTGGALPDNADTVVRYEDVMINDGVATITTEAIKQGQNIHRKGRDKQAGDEVVAMGQLVDATVVSMAASVGKAMLEVKRLPRVVVITTGDELADIHEVVNPYQIRRSNNYTIKAVLQQFGITVAMRHLPDDLDTTRLELDDCLKNYDVVLMSGGVSMGKYDYVPRVLDELGVKRLFHKVQQRPGKPFWFGKSISGGLVFAFPGNPVSTFLCLHRYFVPWLTHSMKWKTGVANSYAVLSEDVEFAAPLQYFMQVAVSVNANGQLEAKPVQGNGSGDFANLLDTNAFMELPMEMSNFRKGEVYRIWPFKSIL
jgi:molybdopterin molybdotransferase